MNYTERAKKILTNVRDAHPGFSRSFQQDVDMIAAEIQAAVEESHSDVGMITLHDHARLLRAAVLEESAKFSKVASIAMETSVNAAKAEAYEKAAKVAEQYLANYDAITAIRALAAEVGK